MKTTSELAAQIVGSKNSVEEFKAEHARVKGILDARMSESRTSKATSELARETSRKLDADDVLTFDDQVATIKSTLDAQATQYREVLKVATDALKQVMENTRYADIVASNALNRIAEITPKL